MRISRRDFIALSGTSAAGIAAAGLARPSVPIPAALAAEVSAGSCGPFALPAAALRPKFRWWWPGGAIEPAEIEREVNAMADAGFGGFEIADVRDGVRVPMDPKVYGWGGARWVAGVERALEVAARRGLKADITLGAHWPTGMPGVTPDDPAAAKELVHGAAIVPGGQRFSGALLRLATPPMVTPQLVALQAYRQTAGAAASPDGAAATVTLDPASRIDLAARIVDSAIDWTAPADGTWHLLVFWMRGTAQIQNMFQMNHQTSMLADPVPYVVDVYGRAGAQVCIDYWERHLLPARTRELLRQIGGNFFEDSLELNAVKAWSPALPEEFEARRGYALLPYLPLLAMAAQRGGGPRFGAAEGAGLRPPYALAGVDTQRFNHDFERTLGQMYAENRIRRLSEWAATLGMGFRVQCSGLAAAYATVPEGDNGDDIDSFGAKAAARDIGGHAVLSDEAATFVGGQSGVANWRLMLFMIQRDFAGGVNQVVLHGFSYADAPGATWPGFSAFGRAIGEDWGPRSPHWALAPDIAAYIGRLQRVLRAGRSQVDLAVLDAAGSEGKQPGGRVSTLSTALRHAGYTQHHLSDELLDHPNAVVENGVLAPKGAGYRALVVMPHAVMEAETARRLSTYAQAGLPIIVIGELPARVPGLHDVAAQEAVLRATLATFAAMRSVVRVADENTVLAALASTGLQPALGYSKPSRVLGLMRRDGPTNYYYFLNDSDAPNALTLSLRGTGSPVRINLWDGTIEPAAVYTRRADRVDVPVAFDRNEAVVLALTGDPALCAQTPAVHAIRGSAALAVLDGRLSVRATQSGRYSTTLEDGREVTAEVAKVEAPSELNSWSLEAEDWRPGVGATETLKVRQSMRLQQLTAWTNIPELRPASGLGRYRTRISLPGSWSRDHGAWLDLGQVGGSFRVYVNGRQLPPANQFTARVDVGPYLRAGNNRVEIEIGTTLNNRLLADGIRSEFGSPGMFDGTGGGPPGAPGSAAPVPDAKRAPDPMSPPTGDYLGAPAGGSGGDGLGMAPGAGNPGGKRTQQDYGLIGPVRLIPYRIARLVG
jgi:hypothetical protein